MEAPPPKGYSATDHTQSTHTTGIAIPAEILSQVLCLLGKERREIGKIIVLFGRRTLHLKIIIAIYR